MEDAETPRLSIDDLCELAARMVASTETAEITRLKREFEQGFYGIKSDVVPSGN
jgi:hypothetical protein